MLRSWPNLEDRDILVIRWPKVVLPCLITGIFSVLLSIAILVSIWAFINNKLPTGLLESIFVIVILILFDLVAILGFVKSVRNYSNPYTRFIANHEGVFFNIILGGKRAFFLPWSSIESINIDKKYRSVGRYGSLIDVLLISFKQSPEHKLPSVLSNAFTDAQNNIYFYYDTLDVSLENIASRLNEMKEQFT